MQLFSPTGKYYVRGEGGCVTPGSCGTVTVTASDSSNPSISCPADQTVNANGSGQGILSDYTGLATSSDNCDASPAITQLPVSGSTISTTTTVTLTATDASNNFSTCTFDVSIVDITPPVFSGVPANITVNTDPGSATAVVNWTAPTADDNVDSLVTPTVTSSPTAGFDNGSNFPVGTTSITYTATDSAGNSVSETFTVTVIDNGAPVFSGVPRDITVTTERSSVKSAVVSWTLPTAFDNVDGVIVPTQISGPASGSVFPVGATTIVFTATDTKGNTATASFTVTVIQAKFPWWILLPELISPNRVSGGGK